MSLSRFFLILTGLTLVSAPAAGQTLQSLVTFKGDIPMTCAAPTLDTQFLTTDLAVKVYVQLTGLTTGNVVKLLWYGPDTVVDITTTFDPAIMPTQCFTASLDIAQLFAPTGFGLWQVQATVDGRPVGLPLPVEIDSAVKVPSFLTLTTSPNPSIAGQTVTLIGRLTPGFLPGIMYFFDNNVEIGAANISAGAAVYTVPFGLGSHSLTAYWGGNFSYSPSVSSPLMQTVSLTQGVSVTATGGTPQGAPLGGAFSSPLQATVRDAAGNPVSGVLVTFAVPASGPSATLSTLTAMTNASGVASVTATANFAPGAYAVTASIAQSSASFLLTNFTAPGGGNLAFGKLASQSSTLPGFAGASPLSAVDGNTDGSFFNGSVASTNLDSNAWWQVDLNSSVPIGTIVVWNRTDCCADRLSDYWVFVSDTPFGPNDTVATLQARAGTFSSHQVTAPNPSTAISVGTQGRYVRVQLTNPGYLSLPEVQVFAPSSPIATNLALGKMAAQSSNYPGSPSASAAVDGNTSGVYANGSVTATNADNNAWWQVDLGVNANVSSIEIWNRTDCCASRLTGFWVFVSNTPFSAVDTPATLQSRTGTFAVFQPATPNPSLIVPVNGQGRFVRVQLGGADYLSLAEVKVLGTPAQ